MVRYLVVLILPVNEPDQTIHLVIKTEEQVLKELQKQPLHYEPEVETRPRKTPPPIQKDGKPVPVGYNQGGKDNLLPF